MENSLKGLMLAAGVVITCIVISLGFYMSREAKNAANNGISQISNMTAVNDAAKEMYDGLSISGREVISVLKQYADELNSGSLIVSVATGRGTQTVNTSYTAAYSATNDPTVYTNTSYINPNGVFKGLVTHDTKGVITMRFTQE
ncbi:MAG: hypothetical protein J6U10_07410 [Lachnospiraceae bacterium]|nr:hypothetical protein [Lachnospiraceae bacterium]MBP5184509.1 hypothetical protein [Lachnospiraceae bacterium]